MFEWWLLLVLALLGPLFILVWFTGCGHAPDDTSPKVLIVLELIYDPSLLINNQPVVINRVDFVIHRENDTDRLENTEALVAHGTSLFDAKGWPREPNWKHDEQPGWGRYELLFSLEPNELSPVRWQVSCQGYKDASGARADYLPAPGDLGRVSKTVDKADYPYREYHFEFTLGADGMISAVAQAGQAATVTLSFSYSGVQATLTKVRFYVTLGTASEQMLELLPSDLNKQKTFLGGTFLVDRASITGNSADFHAISTNAPAGVGWRVRCEGWGAGATPRFPSGETIPPKTMPLLFVASGTVQPFAFTVKGGKAEPA